MCTYVCIWKNKKKRERDVQHLIFQKQKKNNMKYVFFHRECNNII